MALARATASSQSEKDIHNTFMNELSEQNDEAKREMYNSPTFPIRTYILPLKYILIRYFLSSVLINSIELYIAYNIHYLTKDSYISTQPDNL